MLEPHTVIDGRFRIDDILGRGGYGVVYRATQLSIDRPVALKVLHRAIANGEEAEQRFRREARLTSRIVHPNVVRVIDFGDHDGELYLVMELVDGPRLQDRVAHGGALPVPEAIDIAAQIATGLAAAHAEGLVHRDLKPANVLLRTVDGRDQAVVIDFGLARLHDDDAAGDDLVTRSNVMLGTPAYMSPEVVRGTPLDGRSDLYALGILLFRLIAGRLPFRGRTTLETITQHATAPRPALAAADGGPVPPALLGLVAALLATNPDARPSTAAEVARQLRAIAADGSRSPALPHDGDAPTPLVTGADTPLLDPHADPTPRPAPAARAPIGAGAPTERVPADRGGPTGSTAPTPAEHAATHVPETPRPADGAPSRRASAAPWLVAGGVLVAAAVGAALLGSPVATSSAASADAAPDPAAPADNAPVDSARAPGDDDATHGRSLLMARAGVAAGVDLAAADLELRARGHALAVETRRIARDAMPPATAPAGGHAPVGAAPGTLSVQAVPWAQVFVDGASIGETPIVDWSLAPGRYTVELRYHDEAWSEDVRIRAGRSTVIETAFSTPP